MEIFCNTSNENNSTVVDTSLEFCINMVIYNALKNSMTKIFNKYANSLLIRFAKRYCNCFDVTFITGNTKTQQIRWPSVVLNWNNTENVWYRNKTKGCPIDTIEIDKNFNK